MKKFLIICGVIVAAAIGTSAVAFGVHSNKVTSKSYDKIDKFVGEQEKKAQKELEAEQDKENIKLDNETEIVSTKAISDAYLSGDDSELKDDEKELLEEAKKVVTEIIKDGMSDYDKEKAIYDWMFDNLKDADNATEYDDVATDDDIEKDPNTILGALKGKTIRSTVCSMTFRLLANMAGLDCMVVHDSSKYYTWNICKVEDGWYNVDCFTDLTGVRYYSFNFNEEAAQSIYGNTSDSQSNFPKANGTKYDYFVANAQKVDKADATIDSLKKMFDKGDDAILIFAMSKDSKESEKLTYVLEGIASRLRSSAEEWSAANVSTFVKDDTTYNVFKFDNPDDALNSSEYEFNTEKIDKLLNDAFGEPYSYEE